MIGIDVVVFGAGGLGREVVWTLRHAEATVRDVDGNPFRPNLLGFLDDNVANHGSTVNDLPVLGGSEWVRDHPEGLVIVAVGIPTIRAKVVRTLRQAGARFGSILSPDSILGDHSEAGEGTVALPTSVVTTNAKLGRFVLLNPTTSISHDCVVGDFTSLGPGVSLAGNVHVGSGTDIGTNASVIPGVRIGNNAIIGAGACVTEDLPDNVTAVGVPARVIGSRNQICEK